MVHRVVALIIRQDGTKELRRERRPGNDPKWDRAFRLFSNRLGQLTASQQTLSAKTYEKVEFRISQVEKKAPHCKKSLEALKKELYKAARCLPTQWHDLPPIFPACPRVEFIPPCEMIDPRKGPVTALLRLATGVVPPSLATRPTLSALKDTGTRLTATTLSPSSVPPNIIPPPPQNTLAPIIMEIPGSNIGFETYANAPHFLPQTLDFFKELSRTKAGEKLFQKIAGLPSQILLRSGRRNDMTPAMRNGLPGCIVTFAGKDEICYSQEGEWISLPQKIVLFHYLLLAYYQLIEDTTHTVDPGVWTSPIRYRVIEGFPEDPLGFSENGLRRELGLAERFGDLNPQDPLAFTIERTQRLSLIHQRLRENDSSDRQIAQFSLDDIGPGGCVMIQAVLSGVTANFTQASANEPPVMFLLPDQTNAWKLDEALGSQVYQIINPKENAGAVKRQIAQYFPALRGRDFEPKKLAYMRISEEELRLYKQRDFAAQPPSFHHSSVYNI